MVSEAFAMAANGGGQQANPYSGIIMLVLMFAIFYFLLIRPQQKRAKQHRELLDALQVGDQVVTAGGIHGRIVTLQDTVVTLEIATGVKIKVNRASIANKKAAE
ncbi:preprotein translocase subunit YajC [Geoalkalibacter sp.]|uniref:preprotein translocase subunit YajC n=1 Tax=Geoalkalibacter sp. TaxID=3041440 RepID=UPI00272E1CE4|nr:preprotein translocase subunit YajC [Geoalkalibacter sp.]